MPREKKQDEFAGFLANPQALQRGGAAIQALRRGGVAVQATQSRQQRGLLARLVQAEIQRLQQVAELAAKNRQRGLLARLVEAEIQRLQQVVEVAAKNERRGLTARLVEAEIQRLQQVVEIAARNERQGLMARLAEAEIQQFWRSEIVAKSGQVVMPRTEKQEDAFAAAFLVNPQTLRRGDVAVQATRGRQRRELLARLAQAELQWFWRSELAAKSAPL